MAHLDGSVLPLLLFLCRPLRDRRLASVSLGLGILRKALGARQSDWSHACGEFLSPIHAGLRRPDETGLLGSDGPLRRHAAPGIPIRNHDDESAHGGRPPVRPGLRLSNSGILSGVHTHLFDRGNSEPVSTLPDRTEE